MATPVDIRQQAPEFASLTDDQINFFLADAALEVASAVWGALYDLAIRLLACHKIAIAYPNLYSHAGSVTSKKVGDVAVSYGAQGMAGGGLYGSTRFGLEYLRLRRLLCLTPEVV